MRNLIAASGVLLLLAACASQEEAKRLCPQLVAVEMALQAGVSTKTHILNLLHRLTDGTASQVPPIEAPQALVLAQEPEANVARYDSLRSRQGGRHAS